VLIVLVCLFLRSILSTDAAIRPECNPGIITNLTEAIRRTDSTGTIGDTKRLRGLHWFRFTGEAGTRLRNTCPKGGACGGSAAIWSNDRLPTRPGSMTKIRAYSQGPTTFCYYKVFSMEVIRCSEKGDFIYRLASDAYKNTCDFAFCGMD